MAKSKRDTDYRQGRLQGILDRADLGLPSAKLSDAAIRVIESRYLQRDLKGKITETPTQMFERIAWAIARAEENWISKKKSHYEKERIVEDYARSFYELIASLNFLPNSPTLMNAGLVQGQLSACFVLPVEDELQSIFETLKQSALIHKTGGGTGFNFGKIRPKNTPIAKSAGKSAGPIAFMKLFDASTDVVKQGGVRRGANMGIIPVDHPDILAFIDCKRTGAIQNFNISVGITDKFMRAVFDRKKFELNDPKTGKALKKMSARSIWKKIIYAAWASGDPGVVFIDEINRHNPTPAQGKMSSTNPCGEQPLLPFESCNLGSMNLLNYAGEKDFDVLRLKKDIRLAVRFLDNVIEANHYPLPEIDEVTKRNRKIGLGVMGWADVLLKWKIPYDSKKALKMAQKTMKLLSDEAISASEELARERGAFPAFAESIYSEKTPRRNATVTTIAPTGTISIIAGVSSGIEPVFSLAYERLALEKERFVFVHPALLKTLREFEVRDRKLLAKILATGSVEFLNKIPIKSRRFLKTASEIPSRYHVQMQAAFQKYCDNAVSKTINLSFESQPKQIKRIYEDAYFLKCKGITVYRDRSKTSQVLTRGVSRKSVKGLRTWLLDDEKPSKTIDQNAKKLRLLSKKIINT